MSNDDYQHQSNWIDLKPTNSSLYFAEFGNFLHKKFLSDGLINLHSFVPPIDVNIDYQKIFQNGVNEETLDNAFALAKFKINWDLKRTWKTQNQK